MPESARHPELLSPAGNWDCARAAVASGADAIYFGLPAFNARMRAENFTLEDLPALMTYLHRYGVKGYVAMNTLVFASELEPASQQLLAMAEARVDGVIVQDLGLAKLVNELTPSLELHASTQMTLTSPEGLSFASRVFSLDRAVLARELSIEELLKFRPSQGVPLEVFVHGALCVAYSGQCLTSESLGARSANRGECAQACRMPYDLVVDGVQQPMGDVKYLLSPQDLAAVDLIGDLVKAGIVSYKIEGRLKSPEYVAAVTRVYRRAIDDAVAGAPLAATDAERYQLEMTFSRGMTNGWLSGTNHPALTHGKWGKKRGPYVGEIAAIDESRRSITLTNRSPMMIARGEGFVLDEGARTQDRNQEQGGLAWRVEDHCITFDRRASLDWRRIRIGQAVYKTRDPALNKALRQQWRATRPKEKERTEHALHITATGQIGQPLTLIVRGHTVPSKGLLQKAQTRPLNKELLERQLGKLGNTRYSLESVENQVEADSSLALSALNELRRTMVELLEKEDQNKEDQNRVKRGKTLAALLAETPGLQSRETQPTIEGQSQGQSQALGQMQTRPATLHVLCRNMTQVEAALEQEVAVIYADFEDLRGYKEACALVNGSHSKIVLATPRIQKAGETGYFKLIERQGPDGVLLRNLGAIDYFRQTALIKYGDFSLNVANPLTAALFMEEGHFETLSVSYDLNFEQAQELISSAPPAWFEVCLHQHMPLFHMEHCVFCAFMSKGTSYKDCGRPCEKHSVQLRDRVGQLHPLTADVGCRNTLFNAKAQSAAKYYAAFRSLGVAQFRLELLLESKPQAKTLIESYQSLLSGACEAPQLLHRVNAVDRLGVTSGTFEKKRSERHVSV